MTCTHSVGECTVINNNDDIKIGVENDDGQSITTDTNRINLMSTTMNRNSTNDDHSFKITKQFNNDEHGIQPICTSCLVCKDGVCTRRRQKRISQKKWMEHNCDNRN